MAEHMPSNEIQTASAPRGSTTDSDGRISIALVLTATVDPGITPRVTRTDAERRYSDYRSAVLKWSRKSSEFDRILVLENSAHPLASRINDGLLRVELHHSGLESAGQTRGKGYGEAEMLEKLDQLLERKPASYVLKCTGRLYCRNITSLLRVITRRPDVVIRLSRSLDYADSRLILVRRDLLTTLVGGLKDEIDDVSGRYIEHSLARRALKMAADGYHIASWPAPPFFSGRSASTGERYDSASRWLTRPLRLLVYKLSRSYPYV
jgi:hypothetical protein